jgi:hypothetical protein
MVIEKTTRIMKCTMRKIMISLTLMSGLLFWSSPASAASSTISAEITPVRIIVIDSNDQIIAIHTNTQADISPTVERDNRQILLTANIQRQYNTIWPIIRLIQPTKF